MDNPFLKIDHIGIAVTSIDEIVKSFPILSGISKFEIEEIDEQKVKVAFFKCGDVNLEFLVPISDNSTIKKFLDKRGSGIHHIAFEVKDINSKIRELKDRGFSLIDEKPRMGAHNKKIAFIHPRSTWGILIELVEKKEVR